MPGSSTLAVVQVVGLVAAAVAITGSVAGWRGVRPALLGAWASLVVLEGLRASGGEVLHNRALLVVAVVPFVAGPAISSLRSGRAGPSFGWPIRSATFLIAIVYLTTGAQKLRHSGFAWATSDNLSWTTLYADAAGNAKWPWLAEFIGTHRGLAHLLAAASLVLEVGAPVML